jgi:Phage integrase family
MQETRKFKPSTILPPVLGHGRVLPHLRHRRHSGAFTRRARPPSGSACRITDLGLHPPAVRGAAHRRPPVTASVRLRAGGHARPARPADLRSHQRQHRRPRRGTWPPGTARVRQGTKIVLVPLPPAIARAIGRAVADRTHGPVLLNSRGSRMDRHAATRRLRRLAETAGIQVTRAHPHMLRHTFVTTMLDAGVDLRDVQIAAPTPTRAPRCATTGPARTSTATRTTSSPPSWPPAPDPACVSRP